MAKDPFNQAQDRSFNLQRFVDAQAGGVYERALSEIRAGEKRSHWMWSRRTTNSPPDCLLNVLRPQPASWGAARRRNITACQARMRRGPIWSIPFSGRGIVRAPRRCGRGSTRAGAWRRSSAHWMR